MLQRFVYVAVEAVLPEPDGIFTSKVDQKIPLNAFFLQTLLFCFGFGEGLVKYRSSLPLILLF